MIAGRLEVLPGAGTVVRHGGVVVWVAAGASPALLDFLDASARNLAPSPRGGVLLAEHVAAVLARHDPEPDAAFATLGPDGAGGATALLHGATQLFDGAAWQRPAPHQAWSRHAVALGRPVLALRLGEVPDAAGSHPGLDLVEGSVPGGGFALVPTDGAPPRATAERTARPAPSPDVAPTDPVDAPASPLTPLPDQRAADLLTAPLPTPTLPTAAAAVPAGRRPTIPAEGDGPRPSGAAKPPGGQERPPGVVGLLPPPPRPTPATPSAGRPAVPVVRGVRCPAGHFCHPATTTCPRCRADVGAPGIVSGPRPPLGVLVVDDGSIWPLDAAYLLGADPGGDPTVTGGTARALRLAGALVAPVHAELRPSEWQLSLTDRSGASGTYLQAPGDTGWQRLEPHRTVTVAPGSHVAVGNRVVSYLSPWPAQRSAPASFGQ